MKDTIYVDECTITLELQSQLWLFVITDEDGMEIDFGFEDTKQKARNVAIGIVQDYTRGEQREKV